MSIAYLGLGSNIGDRIGYIQQAYKLLADTQGIEVVNTSSLYETEPVGFEDQEWFINAVIEISTTLNAVELLIQCQRIEGQLGRKRLPDEPQWGPRTIDIDILLYDNEIISEANLQIPHPRLHQRAFALVPLLELAPNLVHPVINKTILEIHNELPNPEEVYLYGTRFHDED